MAIVFDMSSGKIQSEQARITEVTEPLESMQAVPALQTVSETHVAASPREEAMQHIRELLKKS